MGSPVKPQSKAHPKTVGKTRDAGFQAGARRTLNLSAQSLWTLVTSTAGQRCLGFAGAAQSDAEGMSTFVDGSHSRRRVPEGLLQVRVLEATNGRATLALHLERLEDASARTDALARLKAALDGVEGLVG